MARYRNTGGHTLRTPRPEGRETGAPIAAHQKLLSGLGDPRWYPVLAVAGITALLLGFWGYWSFGDGSHSASDAVYGSVKLFLWGAALPPEPHIGVSLNIARFLAPLVAGWAAVIALMSLFRDRLQQMMIPLKRGHVVVCGVGYVGFEFLRKLHNAGYRAVVIEENRANPQIDMCRGWGFPVIIGDGRLERTLEVAGVKRAARLLAVTADSTVNTEIVTRARRLAGERRAGPVRRWQMHNRFGPPRLQCLARIDDTDLCVLLRTAESNRDDDDSALDFFNIDEVGARLLLDRYPIDTGRPPHILVVHLGALGAELVLHAARKWHDERGDRLAPLRVSIVGDHAEEQVSSLLDKHPALEQVCDFSCYSATVRDVDRLSAIDRGRRARLTATGELDDLAEPVISRVYVTEYRDERAVEAALNLRRALDPSVSVVVALSRAYAIANLLEDESTASSVNITVFKTLLETCGVELVEGGSFEAIAHEIHRRYREMQPREGERPPPWSQLDLARRGSSRAQARHIGVKLRSIGCEITPLRDWHAKDFRFSQDELNRLTIMEHERWQREKEADGWTLGQFDATRKNHPDLVPWEELPADVADWDRQFVLAIPEMLAAVGLQITDVHGGAQRYPITSA